MPASPKPTHRGHDLARAAQPVPALARRAATAARLALAGAVLACSAWLPVAAQSVANPTAAAEATANTGAPAGFVAPALPQPGESNAERARTQPGNNAPFWRAVTHGDGKSGVTNLPKSEGAVLVQPFVQYPGSSLTTAGEAWRQVRNRWILPYGGSLLLIVLLGLALFYVTKGPLGTRVTETGLKIERFTPFERAAHWSNAAAFVVLAVSGVVMAFGKFFLLPVLGHTLFGWLTYALKTVHNFAGPLFAVSLLIVLITFVRDNILNRSDVLWIQRLGGMLGGDPVPSHRFNAGEKGMFWWGMAVPGLILIGSGLVLNLLVPGWGETRGQMQVANLLHGVGAVWMTAALLGHIYMGTIGTRGALKAMRSGYVHEAWAEEHHKLWLDDVKAGRIPAQRSSPAASGAAGQRPAVPAATSG